MLRIAVPLCAISSFASRAFCVSSPNHWNSLPLHIRSPDSLATLNPVLNFTFSLLPITSSHSYADTSDLTFDYWRYINI